MTTAQRVRRAGVATAAALVIGGGGVAIGAAAAEPDDKVSVTISRDGQDRDVQVTLGELPGS